MKRIKNDDGASLVLFAVIITVVIGIVAIVINLGNGYAVDRTHAVTADAAALSAAQDVAKEYRTQHPIGGDGCTPTTSNEVEAEAAAAAQKTYNDQNDGHGLAGNDHPVTTVVDCVDSNDDGTKDAFRVTVTTQSDVKMLLVPADLYLHPSATSSAIVSGSPAYGGLRPLPVCVDDFKVEANVYQTVYEQTPKRDACNEVTTGTVTEHKYKKDSTYWTVEHKEIQLPNGNSGTAKNQRDQINAWLGTNGGSKDWVKIPDAIVNAKNIDPSKIDPTGSVNLNVYGGPNITVNYEFTFDTYTTKPSGPHQGPFTGGTVYYTGSGSSLNQSDAAWVGGNGPGGAWNSYDTRTVSGGTTVKHEGQWSPIDFGDGKKSLKEQMLYGWNGVVSLPTSEFPGIQGASPFNTVEDAIKKLVDDKTVITLPVMDYWDGGDGPHGNPYLSGVVTVRLCAYSNSKEATPAIRSDCFNKELWDKAPAGNNKAVMQWELVEYSTSYTNPTGSGDECSLTEDTCVPAVRLWRNP